MEILNQRLFAIKRHHDIGDIDTTFDVAIDEGVDETDLFQVWENDRALENQMQRVYGFLKQEQDYVKIPDTWAVKLDDDLLVNLYNLVLNRLLHYQHIDRDREMCAMNDRQYYLHTIEKYLNPITKARCAIKIGYDVYYISRTEQVKCVPTSEVV